MSIDTLQTKIRKKKNPSAVGLDLQPDLIPKFLIEEAVAKHGKNTEALAAAYLAAGEALLDALADTVPAVKLNTAYYELLGSDGVRVMQQLCASAKKRGYYVIVETMRGDVEDAAAIGAQTYFGSLEIEGERIVQYDADSLCVSAFLGSDGIKPYLPYCKTEDKSLFILAKTSNKSSREVQDLISGDRVIHTVMMDLAMRCGNDLLARSGYSEIGAVVGATHPAVLRTLREQYDRLFFLVPGYGAQGGTARDVQHAFDRFGHGAVVAASRSILGAWKKAESDGRDYQERAYQAAVKMRGDIAQYVTVI